jgi:hypothetical protein
MHVLLLGLLGQTCVVGAHISIVISGLFGIVHEMTTWSIWTETDAMKCATQFCLVLRVALQISQLLHTVGKLTFVSVLAFAGFLKWSA